MQNAHQVPVQTIITTQDTAQQAQTVAVQELSALHLALVGGGTAGVALM